MLKNTTSATRSDGSEVRLAMVAEVVRRRGVFGGRVRLRVYGESMLPTLWPGELVEIESCSLQDIRPGEIVLALRDGRFFLHRFVSRCEPNGFLLRGDSVPRFDPQYSREALLGRLVGRTRFFRSSAPKGASDCDQVANRHRFVPSPVPLRGWCGVKWCRAAGTLLCYCSVARRVALRLHRLNCARFDGADIGAL